MNRNEVRAPWATSEKGSAKDPLLPWKLSLFSLGGALGMVGIAFEMRLLRWIAIVALFLGVLLRILPRFVPNLAPDSHSIAPEEESSMEDDHP